MPPRTRGPEPVPLGILLVWVFLILTILIGGFFFYHSQEEQARTSASTELVSVATLKAAEVSDWRNDRLSDARLIGSDQYLTGSIERWFDRSDPAEESMIRERFIEINSSRHYDDVYLTDKDGTVRIGLAPDRTAMDARVLAAIHSSFFTGEPVMTDIYRSGETGKPVMDIVIPLIRTSGGNSRPVGTIVVVIDPEDYLYPYLREWPVPKETAEALLVEREGDHVIFLNSPRYTEDSVFNLAVPLTRTDVPAVNAVLGTTGEFAGRDYRDVTVLSAIEPVRGTPWYIVAKVDTAEALAGWNTRSILIIAMVAGSLIIVFFLLATLSQRRQKYYYRALFETESALRREEERSAEILKTSEEKLHNVVESLPNAMVYTIRISPGGHRKFEFIAGEIERLHGCTIQEALADADRVYSTYGDEEQETILKQEENAIRNKQQFIRVTRLKTADGSSRWVYAASKPRPSSTDGSLVYDGVELDITDQKVTESLLRETEERYRVLFTSMIEGSALHELIYDAAGVPIDYRFLEVNPSFERILGIRKNDVIGKTSRQAYGTVDPPFLETYARVAATGRPEIFEVFFDPMKKYFSISAFSPGKGKFATVFEDITQRKQTEVQREALIRELEQKNTELERFTYSVSHDLKSPLITIKGFASFLEEDIRSNDIPRMKKDIRRIINAADTMQALLSDVLELSRVGKVISPPEEIPFGKVVQEAVELLAGPLSERNVSVVIDPDLPVIYADHTRIREVMVNLIENAIKFSGNRTDPVIRIGVEREGAEPVFFVQDNGIGIESRYLDRIFNLFEKLDPSIPGTGVGLTIVKQIIEVHGGKIWAESEGREKGTTFRFTLHPAGSASTHNNNNR